VPLLVPSSDRAWSTQRIGNRERQAHETRAPPDTGHADAVSDWSQLIGRMEATSPLDQGPDLL
jgi:hypothetical protein